MGRRPLSRIALAALALWLVGPSSAVAATEFGSDCQTTSSSPDLSLVSMASAGSGQPGSAAPVDGVITRWRLSNGVPLEVERSAEALQVYRSTEDANRFTLIAQSAPISIGFGLNLARVRIPVRAGDRLGIHGLEETLYCKTGQADDAVGAYEGSLSPGQSADFASNTGFQVPGVATVEPDADGDGFGDESQDACPQSAAHQGACPETRISSTVIRGRRAVVVYVSSSMSVPVAVTATVGLGGGRRISLAAPTRTVSTRREAPFKLRFPRRLRSRLERLDPEGRLGMEITVLGFNPFTPPTVDRLRPKLRGQAERDGA